MSFKQVFELSTKEFNLLLKQKQAKHLSIPNSVLLKQLLEAKYLKSFFEREDLSYPFIRVIKDGKEIKQEKYLHPNTGVFDFNLVDKKKLMFQFGLGATIVIQKANYQINCINAFCKSFETDFYTETHANIYITPPNSKGFFPHFDTHDVVIIQVEGEKEWDLYDIPIESPTKKQNLTEQQINLYLNKSPKKKVTMKKGDIMYIPRGMVHQAHTNNRLSIHITIGIHPLIVLDITKSFQNQLHNKKIFRESITQENVNEIKENLFNDLSTFIDKIVNKEVQNQTLKYKHFFDSLIKGYQHLDLKDSFIVVPTNYQLVEDGSIAKIIFGDSIIEILKDNKRIVELIASKKVFKLEELTVKTSALDFLIRKLLWGGFITLN